MPFSHTLTPKKPGQPQLPSNHPIAVPLPGERNPKYSEKDSQQRPWPASANVGPTRLCGGEAPEETPRATWGAEDNEVRARKPGTTSTSPLPPFPPCPPSGASFGLHFRTVGAGDLPNRWNEVSVQSLGRVSTLHRRAARKGAGAVRRGSNEVAGQGWSRPEESGGQKLRKLRGCRMLGWAIEWSGLQ